MSIKNVSETHRLLNEVDPGPGRWWKVELVKNVSTKPIKVSLMQSQVEGRMALSEPIGFVRTIATPEKVREAADTVLVMVGGYAEVIGSYGVDPVRATAPETAPEEGEAA